MCFNTNNMKLVSKGVNTSIMFDEAMSRDAAIMVIREATAGANVS